MVHVSRGSSPSLVMSGSARILSQTPGEYEQDGLSHVEMQNIGLANHSYTIRIDPNALNLPYNYKRIHAAGYEDHARAKMDIVLQQVKYAKRRVNTHVLFVFVDDIYASVLADMFRTYPELAPCGATVHLVHFESFRNRVTRPLKTEQIVCGVLFSPF